MDKNNHIDDIFREKLGNYKPEYNPEHWQMMKSAISSAPKTVSVSSGSITSVLLIVVSAIIIVSSGIYTYNLTQKNNPIDNSSRTIAQTNHATKTPSDIITARDHSIAENSSLPDNNNSTTTNINPSVSNNISASTENNNLSSENKATPSTINKSSATDKSSSTQNKKQLKDKTVAVNSTFEKKSGKTITKDGNASIKITSGKEISSVENNKGKAENAVAKNIETNRIQTKDISTRKDVVVENTSTENSKTNTNKITKVEDVSVKTNVQNETNKTAVDVKQSENKKEVVVADNNSGDNNNYSSVTDDYLNEKQKLDQKRKKAFEQHSSKSKVNESVPDCKVAMVNNFVANPAFAGYNQRHTISMSTLFHKPLYKPSNEFNVPFEYSLAYDFNFGKRKNYGVGINYKRYLGAAEGSLDVDLTFAYKIFIAARHNIRFGISASYLVSDINKDNLTFPDMIDNKDGFVFNSNESFPGKSAKSNFDLGAGVWYNWKSLFVGVSAIHLTSPEVGILSNSRIPREYLLSTGYSFDIKKSVGVLPAVDLKYNGIVLKVTPSMLFTFRKWLLVGMEFQNLKNAGLVLGFNMKNNFIINIHSGIPMNKDIIENFGVIDYAGVGLRFQFGNYR